MREHPEGQCAYCDGVEAFEAWVAEYDPEGEMLLLDQIEAYATVRVDDAPLNELDKIEWRDVARAIRPDWTEEQFEEAWREFCELKRRKQSQ